MIWPADRIFLSVLLLTHCQGRAELLKEGDNYSVECSSPGWKYCSWRHEVSVARVEERLSWCCQHYECDRTSRPVEWCDREAGLRWSQGEGCGLELVSLTLDQAGPWTATLLQGQHLNISHRCEDRIRVAERANISLARLPTHFLVGREEEVRCESSGGNPPPVLTAALLVGSERRELQVTNPQIQISTSSPPAIPAWPARQHQALPLHRPDLRQDPGEELHRVRGSANQ